MSLKHFATLLDRLAFEPRRSAKEALLLDYFRQAPDPERGYALASLTSDLRFRQAKPAMLRELIAERTDPELFALSYDFVGDLSETISLMWPAEFNSDAASDGANDLQLSEVVQKLEAARRSDVPPLLEGWLNQLDETGRWALLKLITGGLRIGVSARLAKVALARLREIEPNEIEEIWHGLTPPYLDLFAWLEGKAEKLENRDPVPFRPAMLAHPLDGETELNGLELADFFAEWKWDGIRVQAVATADEAGGWHRRLYTRTGEDISPAFPDLLECLQFDGAIDGELLVVRENKVQPFSDLQRRLNRKSAGKKLLTDYPVALRAYDLLAADGEDLRSSPFIERRKQLSAFLARWDVPRVDLSPEVPITTADRLVEDRADPARHLSEHEAQSVEGLMLKRRDAPYVPGRPKGLWYKWKRDPFTVDAVLMYAQRGHGRRSSFYSDYTFGVWRDADEARELVPVGKAYFGFTDEELQQIDRFVRNNTVNRFGPVREVVHTEDEGLVLEVAFEGLNRSGRHKSGVAMRFPRISRLRWDKPTAEADTLDRLEALLPAVDMVSAK